MKIDRRSLLIGGGAGVGLIVAFLAWPRHLGSDLAVRPKEQAFGNFIKIARDGRITVAVPQAETGQGIWTGFAQIVADELGAAWETIGVEPAPLTNEYGNPLAARAGWLDGVNLLRTHELEHDGEMRITADSTSVRGFGQPLREAAAIAREMLVGAAADRWNVSPRDCETGDGFVINGVRTFTFGELAEEAAGRSPPSSPELRTTKRERLAGQPQPRLDGPAKTTGSWRFAADIRLPGMLYASVRPAPPGGSLEHFDREVLERFPGIRHVAARSGWMAVVADSWWAAEQALHASRPVFSGTRAPTDLRPLYQAALAGGDGRKFRLGDYESAVKGARPLAATYFVAPSQHLGLEPLSATARFSGRELEVWAATQAPMFARDLAARSAHLSESDVTFYPLPPGAPSGRAMEADAIPFAVELARVVKAPVQATLSHGTSQTQDAVAPGALASMAALPGAGGITNAWKMRVATVSGMGSAIDRLLGRRERSRAIRNAVAGIPPYSIPNILIEAVPTDLAVTAGYMRGSPSREFAFFTESFVDELARAAGMEPLSFRMSMLGGNGRLARCLQATTRLAGWDGGGAGSTMGLAGASAFGSHIGLVASASIGEDQKVKVHRLVAAVDCGQVVNSGLVEQQVSAGLVWGLAQATVASPEWVAGTPRSRSVGGLALPRLGDAPEVVVQIIPSSDAPGGISGLGCVPVAPAIANAIHAGSGKRMRSLPFDVAAA